MDKERLELLLREVSTGQYSVEAALESLRSLPYDSVGTDTLLDTHRSLRTGLAEVVYCPGKSDSQLIAILGRLAEQSRRVLATRATPQQFAAVKSALPAAMYNDLPRLITIGDAPAPVHPERCVAVLTAGTADTPVGEEAALTLEWQGSRVVRLYDVGVAGLHRLLDQVQIIQQASAIVVAAGMEGALVSVVAGLVSCPVIAVPTSIGYGTAFGGVAALLTMLNSCAGGVAVVNIDNGFGAGLYAHRINSI